MCPLDDEEIGDDEYFKDMHARRAILQLACCCFNEVNGCEWEGTINDMEVRFVRCLGGL